MGSRMVGMGMQPCMHALSLLMATSRRPLPARRGGDGRFPLWRGAGRDDLLLSKDDPANRSDCIDDGRRSW